MPRSFLIRKNGKRHCLNLKTDSIERNDFTTVIVTAKENSCDTVNEVEKMRQEAALQVHSQNMESVSPAPVSGCAKLSSPQRGDVSPAYMPIFHKYTCPARNSTVSTPHRTEYQKVFEFPQLYQPSHCLCCPSPIILSDGRFAYSPDYFTKWSSNDMPGPISPLQAYPFRYSELASPGSPSSAKHANSSNKPHEEQSSTPYRISSKEVEAISSPICPPTTSGSDSFNRQCIPLPAISPTTYAPSIINSSCSEDNMSDITVPTTHCCLHASEVAIVQRNGSHDFPRDNERPFGGTIKPKMLFKSSTLEGVEVVNGGYGVKNPLLTYAQPEIETDKVDDLEIQVGTDQYACRICKKTFNKPRLLKRHMKCHCDVKRYLCTFCGKGFNDTFDLKRHTRTHTGVRPYKCDKCGKAFTQRCSLESHCKKIHRVEYMFGHKERRGKVYVCEECGYSNNDPTRHFLHLRQFHPNSQVLLKFHDKRQFKFAVENQISTTNTDYISLH